MKEKEISNFTPSPKRIGLKTIKADLRGVKETEYDKLIKKAGQIIRHGGIVAFPTETVYGLGADALNGAAVKLIFEAKGRPQDNPLIIHVSDKKIDGIARNIPETGKILMDKFWPGPLTIIFEKSEEVPYETTAGLSTVGIRMPDNKCALDLISASGGFVAAPSANISGRPSPTTFERCVNDLDGRCEMILGLDSDMVGLESTIVDVTGEIPEVLRPGAVTVEMLEDTIGKVKYELKEEVKPNDKPRAPGMKYTHYSPKAEVTVVLGSTGLVINYLKKLAGKEPESMVIIIKDEENDKRVDEKSCVKNMTSRNIVVFNNIEEASRLIFETLRQADDLGFNKVYIMAVPETGLGLAFMNRVKKSAGYKFLEVDS